MIAADSLVNLVTGLGTDRDKTTLTAWADRLMSDQQAATAYANDWIARKSIDIPVEDALREWRDWQADAPTIAALEAEEKRLRLRATLERAMTWARIYGGAGIIIGDGGTDPLRPLDIAKIGRGGVRYLHAVPRHELSITDIDRDPLSPGYLEPLRYQLSRVKSGSIEIHPSRVIAIHGHRQADPLTDGRWWGESVLKSIAAAALAAAEAPAEMRALMAEAKVDVIKVPQLADALSTAAGTERMTKRFGLANLVKSVHRMLLLGGDESWEQKQITWAGIPDVVKTFLLIASAAADIPVTRFLAQSPAGLSSTGESDLRNYYDSVASKRQRAIGDAMERLDEIIIRSALGARPADIWAKWRPLWQPTPTEQADIELKRAQAVQIYVNSGLIPTAALSKAVVNTLIEAGTLAGLEAAIKEEGPPEDAVEPRITGPQPDTSPSAGPA